MTRTRPSRGPAARWVPALLLLALALAGAAAAPQDPPPATTAAPQTAGGATTDARGPAGAAEAREPAVRGRIRGDRVAVGESIVVPAGTILDGDIVCIFGDVVIEGTTTRSVVVVGGSLRMSGAVRLDVTGVLSDMTLEPGARIGGDLTNVAGRLLDRGAEVRRGYTDIPLGLPVSGIGRPFSVLSSVLLWLRSLSLVLFFIAILILAALVPDRIRALSEETPVRYFAAFFTGLAGYVLLVLVVVLLLSTVVGIPAIPFLGLVFLALKWLGRAGILHLVGQRLGRAAGLELSLLGSVMLALVPYVLLLTLPLLLGGFVGILVHVSLSFLFWLTLDVPAVGLILLTRVGRGSWRAAPGAPAAPLAPPAPPAHRAPAPPAAGPSGAAPPGERHGPDVDG